MVRVFVDGRLTDGGLGRTAVGDMALGESDGLVANWVLARKGFRVNFFSVLMLIRARRTWRPQPPRPP
jgi:hypothetical protein